MTQDPTPKSHWANALDVELDADLPPEVSPFAPREVRSDDITLEHAIDPGQFDLGISVTLAALDEVLMELCYTDPARELIAGKVRAKVGAT